MCVPTHFDVARPIRQLRHAIRPAVALGAGGADAARALEARTGSSQNRLVSVARAFTPVGVAVVRFAAAAVDVVRHALDPCRPGVGVVRGSCAARLAVAVCVLISIDRTAILRLAKSLVLTLVVHVVRRRARASATDIIAVGTRDAVVSTRVYVLASATRTRPPRRPSSRTRTCNFSPSF